MNSSCLNAAFRGQQFLLFLPFPASSHRLVSSWNILVYKNMEFVSALPPHSIFFFFFLFSLKSLTQFLGYLALPGLTLSIFKNNQSLRLTLNSCCIFFFFWTRKYFSTSLERCYISAYFFFFLPFSGI